MAADQTTIGPNRQCTPVVWFGATLWQAHGCPAMSPFTAREPSFDLDGVQSYKPATEQL
jgi:hypothetical protein